MPPVKKTGLKALSSGSAPSVISVPESYESLADSGVERLPVEAYAPVAASYIDCAKLHPIYDRIAFNANLILSGPKGIGKTLSLASWAVANKVPLVVVDCSEDLRRSHLMGMFVLRGTESPFILGPLPTAIDIANEIGHCILCFEEINSCSPQTQKMLNSITDYRRSVVVPECKRIFRLVPTAELWVCGTMNSIVYGGTNELNEDLKSRFRILPLDYPEKSVEQGLVSQLINIDDKIFVKGVLTLAHETRQKALAYSLSPRDVMQILEDTLICGREIALKLASGKFDGTDRDFFQTRVESIFGLVIKS